MIEYKITNELGSLGIEIGFLLRAESRTPALRGNLDGLMDIIIIIQKHRLMNQLKE